MNIPPTMTWTPEKMLEISLSYWKSCCIHAAIRLDVFSKLYEQSEKSDQLAVQCGCDARGMELLITALASMALLEKTAEQTISLSAFARQYLCRQSPDYMGYILLVGADSVPAWQLLHESVKNGHPGQYAVSNYIKEEKENFLLGMHNLANPRANEIAKKLSLQGKKHLLDLGGATGTYSLFFCEQNPDLKVTLFDLPTSEPLAKKIITEKNMQDRIQFAGGNFMQDALPADCDVVWISHILHCFSPTQCKHLIKHVWDSIPSGSTIYIHDFILNDTHDGPTFASIFGLNMLVTTESGQMYSFKDISEMFSELGAKDIVRLHLGLPSDADVIQIQKP